MDNTKKFELEKKTYVRKHYDYILQSYTIFPEVFKRQQSLT